MSWTETTLGDLMVLQRGHDLTEGQRRPGTVPVIGSAGQNGFHDTVRCKGPGLTVGRSGASIGVVTYVKEDFWPHNTALYVRDFRGNDPAFIAALLRSLDLKSLNSGSAQPSLNRNFVYPVRVRVPKPAIQRRIADILSAYDDLIENNTRRIAVLEDMARRLFEEWFVRFRYPGGNGEMPSEWRFGRFGDAVILRKDKTNPGEHLSERHYVPIECIGRKTLALTERRPWQEAQSSLQTFERGDILFGAMRAYFHKVCIAPFAGITRSTCFVLTPKLPDFRAFATLLAFRNETVAYATTHSKGSTIPYAQWERSLENMAAVIPDNEILSEFERLAGPILDTIAAMHETQNNLRTTRDLLLPKLISGEIEVRAAEEALEGVE